MTLSHITVVGALNNEKREKRKAKKEKKKRKAVSAVGSMSVFFRIGVMYADFIVVGTTPCCSDQQNS